MKLDPNRALKNWLDAHRRLGHNPATTEYGRVLVDWINGGGFEPDWTRSMRADFTAWAVMVKIPGAQKMANYLGSVKNANDKARA